MKPIYESLADSYDHISEKIIIARIDADKYKDIRKAEDLKIYPVSFKFIYKIVLFYFIKDFLCNE